MARGWESKSVESQLEDAATAAERRGESLTAAQREARRKLEDLQLARRYTQQQMASTRSDTRRSALAQALAFLDQEIARLTP
jgi:hypothetical protein